MSTPSIPHRGEIWQADLGDGTLTPVIVVSANAFERLPIRLIAPLQPWEERFEQTIWIQRIEGRWPTRLGKPHAADLLRLRSIETRQMRELIGRVPATKMDEIAAAIAIVVDYDPTVRS
ncbi:type II toxin-antitoxin system PemK/MazF family toxin [uncultured Chloroflexus sp.]|uniref:type II toxin-antitoxin system PemK/MazF family toxin n=1 Tax=uncultured Chloroflexus sp. TaxID=214040 RepID=UPI002637F144|nr:type II toxin-antitoxin system PemK/MazF family toxin [uncultured Chloroflexus sp.]